MANGNKIKIQWESKNVGIAEKGILYIWGKKQ